jgi:hypothetical protein
MVTVCGKLAREWIKTYLAQPGSSCDFLPVSQKYYAYNAGFVTLEFEKDWETLPDAKLFLQVNGAESPI